MPEVTYAQLDEVLRALGFSVSVEAGKSRVYRHEATRALVILPDRPVTESARPHHLVTARHVLQEFDIADPVEFALRLQKAHEQGRSSGTLVS